ncbi:MAG: MFS transporter [Mycobacteriaceae bacterium]|nr:MFS transporter [Mycobacteriaceae bacterium]
MLLWTGNAASFVGFHNVRIAYPLLVLTVADSAPMAGWVGFSMVLPSLLFPIPAGVVADRWNRRRTLLTCQLVGLAATGLAAAIVLATPPRIGVLLCITAFLEGSAYAFFGVCELAAVRDVVTARQRAAAFAFLEAEQPIAILIGRASGAAGYGLARWFPFAANAVSYLFCLATLSTMRGEFAARRPTEPGPDTGGSTRIWAGVRVAWSEPFLRFTTAVTGVSNLIIQVVILAMLVDLTGAGRPAWTAGMVLGAAGVGGLLGSAASPWLSTRVGAVAVYRGALCVWSALLLPIAVSTDPSVLALCWCGVGAVGVTSNVALAVFAVDVLPPETLGRAIGAISLVTQGGGALGTLAAGYLLASLGPAATSKLAFAAMLTLAAAGFAASRSVRAAPV